MASSSLGWRWWRVRAEAGGGEVEANFAHKVDEEEVLMLERCSKSTHTSNDDVVRAKGEIRLCLFFLIYQRHKA